MSDSSPGRGRATRGLLYSMVGLVLAVVILGGIVSDAAVPLMDSSGVPQMICWVCPVGLLAGVGSLMGVVTGFVALGELKFTPLEPPRWKAWCAVIAGCLGLTALVVSVVYFGIHGAM